MSTQDTNKLLQQRLNIWSSGDTEHSGDFFATDYIMHGPDGDEHGVESFDRIVRDFHNELDDLQIHYEHVAITEDRVAYVWKIAGTHRKIDRPQTLHLSGVILAHIEEGKFVEEWRSGDAVSLLVNLGLIEARQGLQRMYPSSDSQEQFRSTGPRGSRSR